MFLKNDIGYKDYKKYYNKVSGSIEKIEYYFILFFIVLIAVFISAYGFINSANTAFIMFGSVMTLMLSGLSFKLLKCLSYKKAIYFWFFMFPGINLLFYSLQLLDDIRKLLIDFSKKQIIHYNKVNNIYTETKIIEKNKVKEQKTKEGHLSITK